MKNGCICAPGVDGWGGLVFGPRVGFVASPFERQEYSHGARGIGYGVRFDVRLVGGGVEVRRMTGTRRGGSGDGQVRGEWHGELTGG